MNLFPLATFDVIEHDEANAALTKWGHYLGENDRPFGRQAFGLFIAGDLASVAISASTVSASCATLSRYDVVELARLVTRPDCRWATRVALRLWRELAPISWASKYWAVSACVSYSNETRHRGDIYRFDGWRKFGVMPGSTGGGTYSSKQASQAKAVWVYDLPARVEASA